MVVATLIRIFLMIPSDIEMKILPKRAICGTVGSKGLTALISASCIPLKIIFHV